ncbi:hypothetical protein DFR48_1187 [Ciceribacter lividus]|uniref:Uncharacterized protein n=1 Tax=Ciceribacter lividus TaxID=1197950 RepID=A0A6I7HGI3_9HYPH|nr:DUF6544 family protein [Ciceribacter lividus]RCW19802.1 hypothetical protein DFR48_1187 [Ciceribacter lividus]
MNVGDGCCTTRRQNTHGTEVRELLYLMPRRHLLILVAVSLPVIATAGVVGVSSFLTEREIEGHSATVHRIAAEHRPAPIDPAAMQALPAPVKRYLEFAVPDPAVRYHVVNLIAEGDFRRPLMEGFAPTTASQTIAVRTPALMFAATTPIAPGIWARAYDFFADGQMEMRAKIASTLTVVDESATDELNRTSLRRWLLESPFYPVALLPGGPVRWEAIDDTHARAIVSGFGLEAALVATFRLDGSLASFDAEEDGDLTTPYHGSGEHAARDDYRPVAGMMIPHAFVIARAAGGKTYPFWKGQIISIAFE